MITAKYDFGQTIESETFGVGIVVDIYATIPPSRPRFAYEIRVDDGDHTSFLIYKEEEI